MVNEGDEVNEGDQVNAVNEGDEVNEVNDDEGAVNDGGEAVNEVHVQQHYDEVELTHLEFDASENGEPSQKSERIIKLKLGKIFGDANAPGNSKAKPLTLE
uniref:Uncharacterized protein n=1 Tax=Lactuca sativa TaxID=4236 RepID=A0A9R1WR81_LACSA|nr:hypothetical protein LSAT_V11C100017850 [Lactuca sativa]